MFLVGSLTYAGENYFVHMCTNGSKVRFILFDVYSKTTRDELAIVEDDYEKERLLSSKLTSMLISRPNVSDLEDYVVGAMQSDKKGNKAFFYGDTYILNRFIKVYESVVNSEYKEDNNTTIKTSEFEKVVSYSDGKGTIIDLTEVKNVAQAFSYKTNVSFLKEGLQFNTISENAENVHSAPYKKWEWVEDLDFNNKTFRRAIISLSAKTLAQLREEKDLSWVLNRDGSLKKDYKVLHTMDEVRAMVEEIETNRKVVITRDPKLTLPIAIDCETTGLNMNSLPWLTEDGEKNPLKDEIGGMSLSWRLDQGVYIPFLHTKFQNVDREECLTFLKPYLEEWYLETHNGLFDGKAFLSHGIKLNIRDDSMIMLFNIDPEVAKGSKGLKENTIRRYGHETLDHADVFPSKKDVTSYYDLPEEIVNIYACADSDYTHRLCKDLRFEVAQIGVQASYKLDMRVMRHLIKVNYNGNRVDEKLLTKLSNVVDNDIKTLEETMFKFVGQISMLTQFEKVMQTALKNGRTTEDEVERLRKELMHDEEFKNARYEFSPSKPDVLVDVLYNKLNYKIVRVSKTTGKPTADKYALKDLAKEEYDSDNIGSWLKEPIMSAIIEYDSSVSKEDSILISDASFNKKKYPFVLLLMKWKELTKLKTTFFAWFLNGACDNMYYSDFSMTNAETSRIIGRIQTLKGAMKQLIIPFSDEFYLMGVDFSQIEARLMAYLAGEWDLVERLCDMRADYHVESAAMLTAKEAWEITKSERGELKSVNFAVPYGMAEYSLAENLYGRPITNDKLEKARLLLAKWKKANWEIQTLLDAHRKFAKEHHKTVRFNPDTKKLERCERRFVVNKMGRRRFFKDDNNFKYLASIDRMSGNYPIQSYAAEIFKTAFVNICNRLEKENLSDKVFITALVHDEFLFNIHRSVDKYRLYEIIWEEMVQSICLPYKDEKGNWMKNEDGSWKIDKDNPKKFFFAGISIGPEWHDIHGNDAHEAPNEYLVHMVDKIKSGKYKFKEYEAGDLTEECFNETREFMRDLMMRDCLKLQPDLRPDNIKFYKIVPAFFDYFLKGKLKIYGPKPQRTADKGNESDDIRARLEALFMERFNCNMLYCYDNEDDEVPRYVDIPMKEVKPKTEDIESFDGIDFGADLFADTTTDSDDDDGVSVDIVDMLGDLFDEDLTNFDDDDDDGFDISIPVNSYKDNEAEFEIKSKRTSVNDNRDIWDLVDFKKEVKTYSVEDMRKYMIRSDTIFIDITGQDIVKVKELLNYINTCSVEKGVYKVKLTLNDGVRDTSVRVNNLDREKVFNILGWTLFSAM